MRREAEASAGKPVVSGLSTTFTPMSDWITDRPPTKADGDWNGYVVVRHDGLVEGAILQPWNALLPETHWRHSLTWKPQPKPEPEPPATVAIPRRFVSVRRTILKDGDHILDAIDDQGTAWWRRLDTSPHHPAFPTPEPEWQQLLPLPSHEVPAR